ncbi:hypothetical protein EV702DRAFT_1044335 [Suillus placidus]|uniref:Uncharacterized protein n=1 Tax=Suillus placidus TaxID=48579 RepID=A0A9P6ZY70_9AGAM|nr:hypothetical protein EV702DRAFT_1044335 [Suillus placidus]
MCLLVLFCVFLYLIGVIQAAPTCTTTDSSEASSFTTRTISTIVSSSVLTLFACIYSAIHPNIPSPKDSPNCVLRRRLGIMIMALIAPELVVTWAMRQWLSARHVTRQFKELGYPSIHPGQVQFEPEVQLQRQRENCLHRFLRFLRLLPVMLAQHVLSVLVFLWRFPGVLASSFVLMGGFMLYDMDGTPCLTLRPDYILNLIHNEFIDAPTLTAEQIHDKSKGNAISKGLVMLQVAWFVMQLITRAIYHLETTQLEAGTLAFAVLNFLTYAVWWNKPLDVQCPHPVYWKSTKSTPEDIHVHNETIEYFDLGILAPVLRPILELIGAPRIPTSRKLRVPTFDGSIKLEDSDKTVLQLAGLLMATIFGGIHCMAWFFAFPTYQEQVLWRMSAAAITFTPWLFFLTLRLFEVLITSNAVIFSVFTLYAMLYITARAVLLVLMFTTLRHLPPDAYKAVSWTSLVPHL